MRKGAIFRARTKLGPEPLELLFEQAGKPMAGPRRLAPSTGAGGS